MGIDQHAEHAQRLVVLDKAHPPHVCRQVEDAESATHRLLALLAHPEVQPQVLNIVNPLKPFLERLNVHGAQAIESMSAQFRHQMAADKAARAADDEYFAFHTFETPGLFTEDSQSFCQ